MNTFQRQTLIPIRVLWLAETGLLLLIGQNNVEQAQSVPLSLLPLSELNVQGYSKTLDKKKSIGPESMTAPLRTTGILSHDMSLVCISYKGCMSVSSSITNLCGGKPGGLDAVQQYGYYAPGSMWIITRNRHRQITGLTTANMWLITSSQV